MPKPKVELTKTVIDHLLEINAGKCSITEEGILKEEDSALQEILAGLLFLHQNLEFRAIKSKQFEEELRLHTDYIENVITSMADSLVVINSDTTIRTVNQATLNLLGYQEVELVKQPIGKILREEEERLFIETILETLAKQGSIQNLEMIYLSKSKKEVPVLFSGSAMRDKEGKIQGIVCVAADITERKQMEEDLKKTNQDLITANRELKATQAQLVQSAKMASIGELATGVAHELNQPLTIINFVTENLKEEIKENATEESISALDKIFSQIHRAIKITNHLRTFGRDTEHSSFKKIDLNQIIENAFILINEQLRLQGIEVVQELSEGKLEVYGEGFQIEQILTNLINNAKDAMVNTPEKRLTIRSFKQENQAVIEVEDIGGGIPEKTLERIFDPFFTTKEVGKGTGLGLSISHSIAEKHKGSLQVKSQLTEGTTFLLILPLC